MEALRGAPPNLLAITAQVEHKDFVTISADLKRVYFLVFPSSKMGHEPDSWLELHSRQFERSCAMTEKQDAIIFRSPEPSAFESPRWQAVRLGLRRADNYFGALAMVLLYCMWVVVCVVLCFVLIPFTLSGKQGAFEKALTPVALYCFALPMALTAATTRAVKFFSRLLWCAIPESLAATLLALGSVAGRLAVLAGTMYLWHAHAPYPQLLLLPPAFICSGLAWLGLVADWAFIRTLRRDFLPRADPIIPSNDSGRVVETPTEERVTDPVKKSVFTRDFDPGTWLKSRFPRAHILVTWVLMPAAYVAVSSLADNGDFQAIPKAILRLAVIAPLLIQVLWSPGIRFEVARGGSWLVRA
jgi:hypothetical protein